LYYVTAPTRMDTLFARITVGNWRNDKRRGRDLGPITPRWVRFASANGKCVKKPILNIPLVGQSGQHVRTRPFDGWPAIVFSWLVPDGVYGNVMEGTVYAIGN